MSNKKRSADDRVHFLWQAEVADDNVISFGEGGVYGRIVGRTGSFYVPADELSRVLDSAVRWYLDHRWLLILSGLSDEERDALGVAYTEGEYLDRSAFLHLLEREDLPELYQNLCEGCREMVERRVCEGWQNKDPRVTRELVTVLNRVSKSLTGSAGAFAAILEQMNAEDL